MGNIQSAHNIADRAHIRACYFCSTSACPRYGLGDDLHQRHPGTVIIHKRMVGPFNTAVGTAHMGILAGIIFNMRAFHRHTENITVFKLNIQVPFTIQRLIILGDLIIARHIRIEIILARELRPFSDIAVQSQPELNSVVDSRPVHHREAARKPKGHRGQLRVGLAAEMDFCRAEKLCLCT